ncbi:MAG: VRR-NUC domain-containing protein [Vagococcus sp.]|nr:VRR-NUC domain-containing protein [Vagococcus sp.]
MTEQTLQKEIISIIRRFYGYCWRANAGTFKSFDGKRIVHGLPKGFPDIFGYRYKDGRLFFIEVKNPKGGRIRPEQKEFARNCVDHNVLHGYADSIDDAIKIVQGEYEHRKGELANENGLC